MTDKMINKKLNEAQKFIYNFRGSKNDKCFFCDCNENAIKSHSISESKVLSLIEDFDDKKAKVVYHLENVPEIDFGGDKSISSYHQTHRKLYRKGKSDTSVFFGFCKNCDNLTFEPIDNLPLENEIKLFFLHSLRSKAHYLTTSKNITTHIQKNLIPKFRESDEKVKELSGATNQLKALLSGILDSESIHWEQISFLNEHLKSLNNSPVKSFRDETEIRNQILFQKILDRNNFPMTGKEYKQCLEPIFNLHDEAISVYHKSTTNELELAINHYLSLIDWEINNLTRNFRNEEFNTFEYLHIHLNQMFPISGAFIYQYTPEKECILTFFPEKSSNKTHFIFAVNKGESKYLSFLNFKTVSELKKYLSNVIVFAGSNVFLSPKYWDKLPSEIRDLILTDKSIIKELNINLFLDEYSLDQ
jgi:hypothetical protein